MKARVLQYLQQNPNQFVSGQQMCDELGVTRTSIWKAITSLKEQGYEIESLSKKGYRLIQEANVVTSAAILSELQTKKLGKEILYFESCASTNDIVKQKIGEGSKEGLLVVSDEQTKGKGRLGRQWISPKGVGIWMSLLHRPTIPPMQAMKLTILAGLAMCEGIREVTGLPAQIKWPNDIVVNGKKVCGILTEMTMELDAIEAVVLGIGVNVNTKVFPEEVSDIATSLYLEGKENYSRAHIIQSFLSYWEPIYYRFVEDQSIVPYLPKIKHLSALVGKPVVVHKPSSVFTGIASDLTEDGELIVEDENGTKHTIVSGEVSVRGTHGYV